MFQRNNKMSLKQFLASSFLLFLIFCSFSSSTYAQDAVAGEISTDEAVITAGKTLFNANCKTCHRVDVKLVGPALSNVYDRRDLPWILAFVKNSQKVIKSGDPTAVALYNEYSNTEMTAFPTFSDDEIMSILAYVKDATDNPPVKEVAATDGAAAVGTDSGASSEYMTIILVVLVVVLLLILVVLGLIINMFTNYLQNRDDLDEDDKEIVDQSLDFKKLFTSNGFIGLVTFIFLAIVLKSVIDGLFTVGIQQGYAPVQPIAFSHKIHAGQYEIDCNYCHTGVRKSKNANIPSVNICMNCHSSVKTESIEIQKLYAAIEKDEPIEWVRVHNLPDLAYFNHSQHVAVGEIECQTCHGPIEEMEVVKQYSPLTMGWCIDCHRETDVNTKGNAYYDNLVELHNEHSKEPMKVEDIGGLECAKCHY